MSDLTLRLRVADTDDYKVAESLAAENNDATIKATSTPPNDDFAEMMEPVTAVIIGASLTAAIKFVLDWWDRRRGGLVIDQRPERTDDIYRDPDVPFGLVVVFPAGGGSVTVEAKEVPKDAMERLLAVVLSSPAESLSGLKTAIEKLTGKEKVRAETPI